MFSYAYSKLRLDNVLYYQNTSTQWNAMPLSFYDSMNGRKVGEMSWKINNKLELIDKN